MQVLVGFKAGKLSLDGKVLKADPRKGLIQVIQDELVHIQWSERSQEGVLGAAEDDIVVFPGECQLEQIGSGRTYLLKFSAEPDRNMFFWLQEPDAGGDKLNVARFNSAVNAEDIPEAAAPQPKTGMPSAGSAIAGHGAGAMAGGAGGAASGPAAQAGQLAASLSSALAAAMAGSAPGPSAAEQLAASLLSKMAARGGVPGGSGMTQRQALAMSADQGPSLGEVLRPEVLAPLLDQPDTLAKLAEFLPEEHRNQHAMLETLSSHSFRQQMASFSHALQTGQLSLAQFGLQEAQGFSVADFLEAVQRSVDQEQKQGEDPMQS